MVINHKLYGNRVALEPITENKSTNGLYTGEDLDKGFKLGKVISLGTDIPVSYKDLKIGDIVSYRGNMAAERTDWKSGLKFITVQFTEITDGCLEPVKIHNPSVIIT